MALHAIHNQHSKLSFVEKPVVSENYVFETPVTLPQGDWKLHIEKGDAWVFCKRGNFSVKANETIMFEASDGPIRISRLFVKGTVKYQATQYL